MKKLEWSTKKVKVSDLIELDFNPRKISEEKRKKLIESLEKFNLVEIPAVNKDMKIIGGNQRVKALILAGRGDELIDVRYPNRKLTTKEVKEYNIISNMHAGEFDFETLSIDFDDIDFEEIGFDVDKIEFEQSDLFEKSLNKFEKKKENEGNKLVDDDFNIQDRIKTDIVLGDLIEIGEHRLLCGDSTDIIQVQKLLNNLIPDMIFTDPPYGINESSKNRNRKGENTIFYDFKDDTIEYAIKSFNHEINKKIPVQVWFGANFYCHSLKQKNNWLVWDKRIEDKNKDNNSDCELAWIKSRYNSIRIFRHLWRGFMKDSEKNEKRLHLTQKPIALVDFCIKEYYPKAHLILDYFLGSGTTMVAAHKLNRICYGMELEPVYCQIIIDRMKQLDNTLIVKKNGKEI